MDSSHFTAYLHAFNTRNHEKWLSFYSPAVSFELPNRPPVLGRDGIAAHYAQYEGQFDEEVTVDDIFFGDGGRRVCVEMTTRFRVLVDVERLFGYGRMSKGDEVLGKYIGKVIVLWWGLMLV
jgi:SnoaL-like domain